MWVKTKGTPWWPAQRFSIAKFDHKIPDGCFSQLRNVKRDDNLSDIVAYMYFGTGKSEPYKPEIILMKAKTVEERVVSWSEGWKQGYAQVRGDKGGKGRGKYSADIMVGVWDACNMIKDGSRKPWGWFDHRLPPTPSPSPSPSPEPRAKKRKADGASKGTPKAKKLSKKEEKAIAKAEEEARLAAEAARIKWPKLTALTDFPKSDAFAPAEAEMTLPFEIRKEGKPPFYHKLNRCEWLCRRPPGLIPKEDAEPCLCKPSPECRVAMFQIREAAKAAKEAKKAADGKTADGKTRRENVRRDRRRKSPGGTREQRGGHRDRSPHRMRRGVLQPHVSHHLRPAGVPLRPVVQQPTVPPAQVPEDGHAADGEPRLGSLPRRTRQGGHFYRRVRRRDSRRAHHREEAVGG